MSDLYRILSGVCVCDEEDDGPDSSGKAKKPRPVDSLHAAEIATQDPSTFPEDTITRDSHIPVAPSPPSSPIPFSDSPVSFSDTYNINLAPAAQHPTYTQAPAIECHKPTQASLKRRAESPPPREDSRGFEGKRSQVYCKLYADFLF
jgi:hypothetical protein